MNRATRIIAATVGVIFAIGGMTHGFFEVLQGNTFTGGPLIYAISDAHRMWPHGSEAAFTIIPNFLLTGLAAIAVSVAIIIWSLGFLHTRHGATVFLLLFVLLFLVGGGIGQVAFFIPTWAFATRINRPLTWWRKALPDGLREPLAGVWPWTISLASVLILTALAISVFGYFPGFNDADQLLSFVFALLGVGLMLIVVSFISGFAYDIQHQPEARPVPAMSVRRT